MGVRTCLEVIIGFLIAGYDEYLNLPKIGGEKRSKKKFKFACDQRVEKSSWEEITFESSGGPFSRTRRNQSMRREGDEGNSVRGSYCLI